MAGCSRPWVLDFDFDANENPRNCKSSFILVSLHCQNAVAEKRSIALNVLLAVRTAMVPDDANIVAADLKGASWRRKGGTDQPFDSIREVALKKTQGFLRHLALHFCGVLEECQVKGQTCGLFVRPANVSIGVALTETLAFENTSARFRPHARTPNMPSSKRGNVSAPLVEGARDQRDRHSRQVSHIFAAEAHKWQVTKVEQGLLQGNQ